jgi:hypothetical protein
MHAHYEAFCLADPYFYDLPGTQDGMRPQSFGVTRRALPTGWQSDRLGIWLAVRPENAGLPTQGWKVHVSACLHNAEGVLSRVWDYCVHHRLAFKFLSDPTVLLAANAKYAERGDSGKFVTIYPRDERQLQQLCEELSEESAGQPGPYVLSDLRWGAGPLYVRHGGFAERVCAAPTGEVVPAIERPDGTLVSDPRRPVFAPPDWVELPSFLQPHLAARTASSSQARGYRIDRALHFSNGGGVYVAQRQQIDHYALAAMRLFLFLPLNAVFAARSEQASAVPRRHRGTFPAAGGVHLAHRSGTGSGTAPGGQPARITGRRRRTPQLPSPTIPPRLRRKLPTRLGCCPRFRGRGHPAQRGPRPTGAAVPR